jgi:uncharacterized membrane protein
MDDFDKNGFDKVSLDASGKFNSDVKNKYIDSKPRELLTEIKLIIRSFLQARPSTIIIDNDIKLFDRKALVEFKSVMEKVDDMILRSLGSDIKDVYDFIISRYTKLHKDFLNEEEKS